MKRQSLQVDDAVGHTGTDGWRATGAPGASEAPEASVAPEVPEAPEAPETRDQGSSPSANLIINFLPQEMGESQLRQLFSEFGPIQRVKIVMDRRHNRSMGYGFVRFFTVDAATAAIAAVNGRSIGGRRLRVAVAEPQARVEKSGVDDTNVQVREWGAGGYVPKLLRASLSSGGAALARSDRSARAAWPALQHRRRGWSGGLARELGRRGEHGSGGR